MRYENPRPPYPNELYHHGVLGMHWGIRRYQPYRKGEHVKGGHFIGQAIAKNRTTRDSYLSSFLASDYQRKADKLHEEADRRKSKYDTVRNSEKPVSNSKLFRRKKRYLKAKALADDNQSRADFWKQQAKEDIETAKKVNKQFAADHPNTLRKAPAKTIESGANRWVREHTRVHVDPNTHQLTVHRPKASNWQWDRGWGHQWAAEKTKGFNYRGHRDAYKNVTKKNLKDEKKASDLYDKREKLRKRLESGKFKTVDQSVSLENQASDISNKMHSLYSGIDKRSREWNSKMMTRAMLDPVRNPNRVEYQNYMNRTRENNMALSGKSSRARKKRR